MGDVTTPFILTNIGIFCMIFWLLTIVGENYFIKKKEQNSKKQFYECGFKSLTDNNITVNVNFTLIALFLVLYDVEFTLLFPVLFNFGIIGLVQYIYFLLFIFLILLSLYYDWQVNALNWQF